MVLGCVEGFFTRFFKGLDHVNRSQHERALKSYHHRHRVRKFIAVTARHSTASSTRKSQTKHNSQTELGTTTNLSVLSTTATNLNYTADSIQEEETEQEQQKERKQNDSV